MTKAAAALARNAVRSVGDRLVELKSEAVYADQAISGMAGANGTHNQLPIVLELPYSLAQTKTEPSSPKPFKAFRPW